MKKDQDLIYKERARIIKAVAHPSRLIILEKLSKGERCVCELVEIVGSDFSTVSKHLTILKNAGIIEDDKRGKKIFYSLKCPCIMGFVSCVEKVIKNNLKRKTKLLS